LKNPAYIHERNPPLLGRILGSAMEESDSSQGDGWSDHQRANEAHHSSHYPTETDDHLEERSDHYGSLELTIKMD